MNNIESIQDILEKEVSRKEFLVHIGVAVAAAVGISSVIRNIFNSTQSKETSGIGFSGYGESGYSGIPRGANKGIAG